MQITEAKIFNYHSIKECTLEKIKTVNILVGRNGSGKSNILRALHSFFTNCTKKDTPGTSEGELFDKGRRDWAVATTLSFDQDDNAKIASTLTGRQAVSELKHLMEQKGGWSGVLQTDFIINSRSTGDYRSILELFHQFLPDISVASSVGKHGVETLAKFISEAIRPGFIQTDRTPTDAKAMTDIQPVDRLVPTLDNLHSVFYKLHELADIRQDERRREIEIECRKIIGEISRIYRSTEQQTVRLFVDVEGANEVRYNNISDGGKRVILLVTYLVTNKDRPGIVLLDSPENHLHPGAQRELAKMISDPQYSANKHVFIATHSPVFLEEINAENTSVYRITRDANEGTDAEWLDVNTVINAYSDLGHRFGSAIQADAVIWVEGPSDMVVIRRCLDEYKGFSGKNIEVMHLGGENIICKHFSPSVLSKINPISFVIIDSELKNPAHNVAGKRGNFIEACKNTKPGIAPAVITERRSIENYLVDAIDDSEKKGIDTGHFAEPDPLKGLINKVGGLVKVADEFAKNHLKGTDIDKFLKAVEGKINQ